MRDRHSMKPLHQAGLEFLDGAARPRSLRSNRLNYGKQIFRSMGGLAQEEMKAILCALAFCYVPRDDRYASDLPRFAFDGCNTQRHVNFPPVLGEADGLVLHDLFLDEEKGT